MRLKFTFLVMLFILVLSPLVNAEINEIDTGNWVISKSDGVEALIDITLDGEEIILDLLSVPPQDRGEVISSILSHGQARQVQGLKYGILKGNKKNIKIGDNTLLMEQDNFWNLSTDSGKNYYIGTTGFWLSNFEDFNQSKMDWMMDDGNGWITSREYAWNWTVLSNTSLFAHLYGETVQGDIKWQVEFSLTEGDELMRVSLYSNATDVVQRLLHYDINISQDTSQDYLFLDDDVHQFPVSINDSPQDLSMEISDSQGMIIMTFEDVPDGTVWTQGWNVTLESSLDNLTVYWTDPALAQGDVEGISISPLGNDSFVVAWCEEISNDIIARLQYANGTNITGDITVDADIGTCDTAGTMVETFTFNSTHWGLCYNDDSGDNIEFNTFNVGTLVDSTTADADAGGADTVSCASLNSTDFIIGWNDDGVSQGGDRRAKYASYDYLGIVQVAETNMSNADIGTSADISCDTANSTAFSCVWHDDTGLEPYLMDSYVDFVLQYDEVVIDNDASAFSEVDIAFYNQTHLSIFHIEQGNDLVAGTYTFSGTHLGNVSVDTTSGGNQMKMSTINSSASIVMYTHASTTENLLAIVDSSLNILLGPTQINPTSAFGVYPASRENVGFEFCDDNLVIASSFAPSGDAFWTANTSSLGIWNGSCEEEISLVVDTVNPEVNLNSPSDNTITNITLVNFNCTVTDDVLVSNISLYHNGSGTFSLNETSFVSGNTTSVFNKTFDYNSSIVWNCEGVDNSSNSAFAGSNFTWTLNQTFIEITVTPEPNVSTSGLDCLTDPEPPYKNFMYWLCTSNLSTKNSLKCLTKVEIENQTVQINPERKLVEAVGELNSFTEQNGIIVPYFKNDGLRENREYKWILECSNDSSLFYFNATVTPKYLTWSWATNRIVWSIENAPLIFGLLLLWGVVLILLIWLLVKVVRR